jgi:hypothetical protein
MKNKKLNVVIGLLLVAVITEPSVYAYCQDPVGCNLFNKEGLPALPFRTDEW